MDSGESGRRRHFPLKDVATAGGWRDVQTMITSISSPDSETMRAVVDLAKPPDRASGCYAHGQSLTQSLTQR